MSKREQAAVDPVRPQSLNQTQAACSAIACVFSPRVRCKKVLTFEIKSGEPASLRVTGQLGSCFLRQGKVEIEMPGTDGSVVATIAHLFLRIVPHRIEHPIAFAADLHDDQ